MSATNILPPASILPVSTPSDTMASSISNASIDPQGQEPDTDEINGVPEEIIKLLTADSLPDYTAIPSTAANKPWHSLTSLELRTHLVRKLVQAIFSTPNQVALGDRYKVKMVNYARKVEKNMFEQASSRRNYYHLIAEKIYKIQELEERQRRTFNEIQALLSSEQDLGTVRPRQCPATKPAQRTVTASISNVSTPSNTSASSAPSASDPNSQAPTTEKVNSVLEGLHSAESLPECTVIPPSADQPWHAFIPVGLRTYLVYKLLQGVFPSPDQAALVEKEMFDQASSREEYYHLMGEKIYKIQEVLEEKRQRCLAENQGRSQPQ